jgi:hypothetical protein
LPKLIEPMADIKPPPPAILLAAIFSHHHSALEWAIEKIGRYWGAVGLTSPTYDHSETGYYSAEMGDALIKQFVIVEGIWDPSQLASVKLQAVQWEKELAASLIYPQQRPVNIDPGYLTLGKLVLASAKDRAHRIYLRDGVYAEECLYYLAGWKTRPWTYPDYQRSDFQEFFSLVRQRLKHCISQQHG